MPNFPVNLSITDRIRGVWPLTSLQRNTMKYLIAGPVPSLTETTSKQTDDTAEDIATPCSLSSVNSSLVTASPDEKNASPPMLQTRSRKDQSALTLIHEGVEYFRSDEASTANMSEANTLISSPYSEPAAYLFRDTSAWQKSLSEPGSRNVVSFHRPSGQFRVQKLASKWNGRTLGEEPSGSLNTRGTPKTEYKSTAWGRLKDDVAKAGKDKWTVACIKATSRFRAPPDEKQLRTILAGLREGGRATDRDMPLGAILYQLRARLDSSDWTVVLKTQIVFHTVLRAGNQHFVNYIASALPDIFNNERFDDMSAGGVSHTPFIRTYDAYLQNWLEMRECIKFPSAKTTDPTVKNHFRESSIEELLVGLPLLMNTVSILNKLDLSPRIKKSPVANAALFLLLRDQTSFITALSTGIERLMELFYTLSRELAIRSLDVYIRYRRMMGRLRFVIEALQSIHPGWHVPLDLNSKSFTEDMQKYIEEDLKSAAQDKSMKGLRGDRKKMVTRTATDEALLSHAMTPYPSRQKGRGRRVLSQIEQDLNISL